MAKKKKVVYIANKPRKAMPKYKTADKLFRYLKDAKKYVGENGFVWKNKISDDTIVFDSTKKD